MILSTCCSAKVHTVQKCCAVYFLCDKCNRITATKISSTHKNRKDTSNQSLIGASKEPGNPGKL